ncbi:hypothetical protein FJT64_009615 [Amphibalanus amphitrite]|uniref:Uncharacterized protein n=1 Tax=Amphibalanus amphitrite TaxID=1232801 RepID=A0A6A4VQJ8_AMPAM|nr:hypothetical protein FJT64_009615 [Amphibalanus amphitrite]
MNTYCASGGGDKHGLAAVDRPDPGAAGRRSGPGRCRSGPGRCRSPVRTRALLVAVPGPGRCWSPYWTRALPVAVLDRALHCWSPVRTRALLVAGPAFVGAGLLLTLAVGAELSLTSLTPARRGRR